jgi:hypothetical protein
VKTWSFLLPDADISEEYVLSGSGVCLARLEKASLLAPRISGGGKLSLLLRLELESADDGDVEEDAGGDGVKYRSRSPFETGR